MSAAAIDAGAVRPSASRWMLRERLRGLYALTPDLCDTAVMLARVTAAIDGGACAIQYRNKSAGASLRHAQAAALAAACRRRALLIINDDPALAAAVDADGVHIGEHDGGVAAARAIVGDDAIVGVSCYDDMALARAAVADGADYIAFGSFFTSQVKPSARHARATLLHDARLLGVPVVAIGGITLANAGALVAAGADAAAVISDVLGRAAPEDIRRAAHAFNQLFAAAPQARFA